MAGMAHMATYHKVQLQWPPLEAEPVAFSDVLESYFF